MKSNESYSDHELARVMDEIEKMSDGAPMYNGEPLDTGSLKNLQHALEIATKELKKK